MAEKFSRRAMVRGAVGTALATAAAPLAFAQDPKVADDAGLDRRLDEAEKKLIKPLDPEVKKIARRMVKSLDTESVDRLKTKLPENSEPCFTYVPTAYVKPGSNAAFQAVSGELPAGGALEEGRDRLEACGTKP